MRICPECEQTTEAEFCPQDGSMTINESLLHGQQDAYVGRLISDRYRLIESLGHGAMGRVYVAEQLAMKRRVAVKLIRADTDDDAEERLSMVKRFQREALAASELEHPNTVRVFDYGHTDDGILFLAMELVRGPTLAQVFRTNKILEPSRMIRIAIQVCKSLAEAHEHGIIHRDLKPENIIVTEVVGEKDFAKVLDFGIAKVLQGMTGRSKITKSGTVLGTPIYMSPEQGSAKEVTPVSDLYSLGVILYAGISGRPPFKADTPLATLWAHAREPVPPLVVEGFPPKVPRDLEDFILGLLEKEPTDRPATALEVIAGLESLLERIQRGEVEFSDGCNRTRVLPVSTAADDSTVALDTTERIDSGDFVTEIDRWLTVSRRRGWIYGFGVGGIVVIGVLGGLFWGYEHDFGCSGPFVAPKPDVVEDSAPDPIMIEVPLKLDVQDNGVDTDLIVSTDDGEFKDPGKDIGRLKPPPPSRRCTELKCPIRGRCLDSNGLRVKGKDYCRIHRCSEERCKQKGWTRCWLNGRWLRRNEYCYVPFD